MPNPSVVFGGPSWEHDVSILTGLQALRVLARGGAEPIGLYWSELNGWFRVPAGLEASAFLEGVPKEAQPLSLEVRGEDPGFYESRSFGRRTRLDISAAVICCHGGPGEDGRLQGMLDLARVAYTGPSSDCAALTMDKLAFGGIVQAANLPALPRVAWSSSSPEPPFPGPYIVKPRFGGSSIGIEVTQEIETARDLVKTSSYLSRGAVLEQYVPGLEDLYIAIRTYPQLQLSLIERPRPQDGAAKAAGNAQIYGYKQKYLEQRGAESKVSEIPAGLPGEAEKSLRIMAEEIARLTRLTGAARLDFLWDGSQIWVNELNSIPGALAFRLWAESGVSHEDLLSDMLAEAGALSSALRNIDPPDRFASERKAATLQSAGMIADKLA
jgi:D-alanine-D-alanine ligase